MESIELQPITKKDIPNIKDVSLTVAIRFFIPKEQALHLQSHLICFIVQTLVLGMFLIFLIVLLYFIFYLYYKYLFF